MVKYQFHYSTLRVPIVMLVGSFGSFGILENGQLLINVQYTGQKYHFTHPLALVFLVALVALAIYMYTLTLLFKETRYRGAKRQTYQKYQGLARVSNIHAIGTIL